MRSFTLASSFSIPPTPSPASLFLARLPVVFVRGADDRMYLFMELMSGGELFDRIVDMGHFTEKMAQDVTFKLIGALDYMHKKGIAHRDLKP